jgi:hypothetical protein
MFDFAHPRRLSGKSTRSILSLQMVIGEVLSASRCQSDSLQNSAKRYPVPNRRRLVPLLREASAPNALAYRHAGIAAFWNVPRFAFRRSSSHPSSASPSSRPSSQPSAAQSHPTDRQIADLRQPQQSSIARFQFENYSRHKRPNARAASGMFLPRRRITITPASISSWNDMPLILPPPQNAPPVAWGCRQLAIRPTFRGRELPASQ